MSRITMGGFMVDINGSTGGTTFQKNRWGLISRNKVIPRNPKSLSQQRVRLDLTELSRLWRSLTDNQRLLWTGLADRFPQTSRGRQITLTGFLFFCKLNRNLQEIGEAVLNDTPQIGTPQVFDSFSVDNVTTPGSEDLKLNIAPAINADTKIIVYATPIISSGVKNASKMFREITVLDNTFLTGSSIKDAYIAKFGGLPKTGEKAQFGIKSVLIGSGYANIMMTNETIGTV